MSIDRKSLISSAIGDAAILRIARAVQNVPASATHVAVRYDGEVTFPAEPAWWVPEADCYFDEDPAALKGRWATSYRPVYWAFVPVQMLSPSSLKEQTK